MNSKLVCFFALIATAFAAPEYIYPSGLPAYAPFAPVSSLARFGAYNPYTPYSPYSPYGRYAPFAPAPIETAPIEAVRTVAPVATEVAAPLSPFGLAPASNFLPYARIASAAPIEAHLAAEVAAPLSPFGLTPASNYLPYARFAPQPFGSAYSFLKTIEAKKFPAGVEAEKCPKYPFCDHPELPSIDLSIPALPMHTEPQIPADVVGCPDYPFCDTPEIPAIDESIPALPMHTEPQIPANVDPAKCPGYPLCDVSAPIIVESA